MIKNYEGKMIDEVKRMERTTEDDRQTTEDDPPSNYTYLSSSLYSYHHFRTFRWLQTFLFALAIYFEDENFGHLPS